MATATAQAVRIAPQFVSGAIREPLPFPRPKPVPPDVELPDVAALLTAAYARHQRGMRWVAWTILDDWTEAEDATQVAFERVWAHRAKIHHPDHIGALLYRVMKHYCYDRLRHFAYVRRALRGEPLPLDWPPDQDDPDGMTLAECVAAPHTDDPERAAVRARVRRVLARMPRSYAEALLLVDGAGWKQGRAATFANLGGTSAVKMRVARARDVFAWHWTHLDDPTTPTRPSLKDLPHVTRRR